MTFLFSANKERKKDKRAIHPVPDRTVNSIVRQAKTGAV